MYEGIYKSSDFTFFSNANEEIYPNFWLEDMRYANQEKTNNRKFFSRFADLSRLAKAIQEL